MANPEFGPKKLFNEDPFPSLQQRDLLRLVSDYLLLNEEEMSFPLPELIKELDVCGNVEWAAVNFKKVVGLRYKKMPKGIMRDSYLGFWDGLNDIVDYSESVTMKGHDGLAEGSRQLDTLKYFEKEGCEEDKYLAQKGHEQLMKGNVFEMLSELFEAQKKYILPGSEPATDKDKLLAEQSARLGLSGLTAAFSDAVAAITLLGESYLQRGKI
jgi:hypothetical protein